MIWMFRQRGQRVDPLENEVIKEAFCDDQWNGKKTSLVEKFKRTKYEKPLRSLISEWNEYNIKSMST